MKPLKSNAFLRSNGDRRHSAPKSLAGLLSPMRATLSPSACGFELQLEPMRALDALAPWAHLRPNEDARTLLCRPGASDGGSEPSLAALADRLALPAADRLDEHQLVLDPAPLGEIAAATALEGLLAVLIDGPIEREDGRAILRTIEAGRCPLEGDLRALAAMQVRHDRAIVLQTRDIDQAAAFVAEDFRHYLAALRDQPSEKFAAPELALVERMLDRTGRITVRPIETEVYSTSIDVGISTSSNGELRAADGSLIYDIPSNSWHGD